MTKEILLAAATLIALSAFSKGGSFSLSNDTGGRVEVYIRCYADHTEAAHFPMKPGNESLNMQCPE